MKSTFVPKFNEIKPLNILGAENVSEMTGHKTATSGFRNSDSLSLLCYNNNGLNTARSNASIVNIACLPDEVTDAERCIHHFLDELGVNQINI